MDIRLQNSNKDQNGYWTKRYFESVKTNMVVLKVQDLRKIFGKFKDPMF